MQRLAEHDWQWTKYEEIHVNHAEKQQPAFF